MEEYITYRCEICGKNVYVMVDDNLAEREKDEAIHYCEDCMVAMDKQYEKNEDWERYYIEHVIRGMDEED